jgi:hypothetical protein
MDHVPPKTIFEPHDQSNLITVPCCRRCNNSASTDDQYFLVNIALREGAKQKPEHERLWQKALRTLRRKEASKFRQSITSKIKFVQQVTPTGIILSPALSIPSDGLRVIGVVIRIVKGLYFPETGNRLADTHRVIAYDELALLLALRNTTPGRAKDLSSIRDLIGNVQTTLRKTVGRVFAYHWASNPADAATSMWLLDFFEGIRFFCITQPPATTFSHNLHFSWL